MGVHPHVILGDIYIHLSMCVSVSVSECVCVFVSCVSVRACVRVRLSLFVRACVRACGCLPLHALLTVCLSDTFTELALQVCTTP